MGECGGRGCYKNIPGLGRGWLCSIPSSGCQIYIILAPTVFVYPFDFFSDREYIDLPPPPLPLGNEFDTSPVQRGDISPSPHPSTRDDSSPDAGHAGKNECRRSHAYAPSTMSQTPCQGKYLYSSSSPTPNTQRGGGGGYESTVWVQKRHRDAYVRPKQGAQKGKKKKNASRQKISLTRNRYTKGRQTMIGRTGSGFTRMHDLVLETFDLRIPVMSGWSDKDSYAVFSPAR